METEMVVEFSEYENMCNEIGSTFEKYGANINDMMEKYKELCKEKHQIHEKMKLQLGNLLKKRKLITDLSEQLSFALSDGKERNIEANSTVNIDRDDDTGFDNETLCDNDTEDAYRTPTMETSNKFRRDIEHLSSQNL